jgi:type IV fimbrial biogenesis protein FimT
MTAKRQTGFTLWELLVTVLVMGIIFGFGVPNFREFQRNGAMTAAANDLVTGILRARSEAVKRQVPVSWCLSDDPIAPVPVCARGPIADSTRGFVVWIDENDNPDPITNVPNLTDLTDGNADIDAGEEVLMRRETPGGTIQVSASCGYVAFTPTGRPRNIPGLCPAPPPIPGVAPRAILFCDDRGSRRSAGDLSSARVVEVDQLGRGLVLQEFDDITGASGSLAVELAAVNPTCPAV